MVKVQSNLEQLCNSTVMVPLGTIFHPNFPVFAQESWFQRLSKEERRLLRVALRTIAALALVLVFYPVVRLYCLLW